MRVVRDTVGGRPPTAPWKRGLRCIPTRGDTSGPGLTFDAWTSSSRTRTRTSTRFAAMLAARRLYPGAAIALSGSLNRNVREFYRLHADELELVDAAGSTRPRSGGSSSSRRSTRERLGEFERVARDPGVEVVVFDHHAGETPDWVKPENLVLSEDGALTTTMVGILAEREIEVTPLEATVFALGIHEDTGSLGYAGRRRARRGGARVVPAPRRPAGHVAQYLRTPLADEERALLDALVGGARDALGRRARCARRGRLLAGVRRRRLQPRPQDRRSHRRARARLPRGDGRPRLLRRAHARPRARRRGDRGRARRRGASPGRVGRAPRHARGGARARRSPRFPRRPGRCARPAEIMSRPARFVGPEDTVADAMVLCQRHRQSGILVGDERAARRPCHPRAPRPGDRARSLPRAGEERHERRGRSPAPRRRRCPS